MINDQFAAFHIHAQRTLYERWNEPTIKEIRDKHWHRLFADPTMFFHSTSIPDFVSAKRPNEIPNETILSFFGHKSVDLTWHSVCDVKRTQQNMIFRRRTPFRYNNYSSKQRSTLSIRIIGICMRCRQAHFSYELELSVWNTKLKKKY